MTAAWQLHTVHIAGFRGVDLPVLLRPAAGLTMLIGDNGTGKSSVLAAIEWGLFGNEVEKKSSGIDERGDWAATHRRGGGVHSTRVELTFQRHDDEAILLRERTPGRSGEHRQLQLEGSTLTESAAIDAWLREAGLPDWSTYKAAFSQHQETTRDRLLDQRDRSDQLASLLGMASSREYGAWLGQQAKLCHDARRAAESDLERLARHLEHIASLDADDPAASDGLAEFNLPTRSSDEVRGFVQRAILTGRRGLEAQAIEFAPLQRDLPRDLAELGAYLDEWPEQRRAAIRADRDRLDTALAEATRLQRVLDTMQPARQALTQARQTRANLEIAHGTAADLHKQATETEHELTEQRARLAAQDRHAAVLESCRTLLDSVEDPDHCPVCRQRSSGLAEQIDGALAALSSDGATGLRAEIKRLEERLRQVTSHRQTIDKLELEYQGSEAALQRGHGELQTCLHQAGEDIRTDDTDILASSAETRLQALADSVRSCRARLRGFEALDDLEDARRLVQRYRAWRARSARSGDDTETSIETTATWTELQADLDLLAGYCADLDALGGHTRSEEEAESQQRLGAVNETLASWFELITGPGGRGLRVQEKRTNAKLTYRLVDGEGEDLTPILNQASLNALALALLFAQAEHRARAGAPQWVVLDEPAQNLDKAHQHGLAKAVRKLAATCPVIASSLPGTFASLLAESDGCRRLEVSRRDDATHLEELR